MDLTGLTDHPNHPQQARPQGPFYSSPDYFTLSYSFLNNLNDLLNAKTPSNDLTFLALCGVLDLMLSNTCLISSWPPQTLDDKTDNNPHVQQYSINLLNQKKTEHWGSQPWQVNT